MSFPASPSASSTAKTTEVKPTEKRISEKILNLLVQDNIESFNNSDIILDENKNKEIVENIKKLHKSLMQKTLDGTEMVALKKLDDTASLTAKVKRKLQRGAYFEAQYIQMNLAMLLMMRNVKDVFVKMAREISDNSIQEFAQFLENLEQDKYAFKQQLINEYLKHIESTAKQGGALEIVQRYQENITNSILEGVEEQFANPRKLSFANANSSSRKNSNQRGGFVRGSSTFPAQEFSRIEFL